MKKMLTYHNLIHPHMMKTKFFHNSTQKVSFNSIISLAHVQFNGQETFFPCLKFCIECMDSKATKNIFSNQPT